MAFWTALKRRHFVKVAAVYLLAAALLAQVAAILFPVLHLPAWSVTFVVAFLTIGFPITVFLAWAYEGMR